MIDLAPARHRADRDETRTKVTVLDGVGAFGICGATALHVRTGTPAAEHAAFLIGCTAMATCAWRRRHSLVVAMWLIAGACTLVGLAVAA